MSPSIIALQKGETRPVLTSPPPPTMGLFDIILAIILPPLAVFLKKGLGKDFIINILLTICLLWVGGIIHAIWAMSRKD
ncbi:MAG: YqaE/Pmp3 family membrane protein [Opitutaceae bacterium]